MNSLSKDVFFGRYIFEVPPEVYEPAEDTFLLAKNLSVKNGASVLDMGTGCGILAVLAAEKASIVVAVDINPHAVACTLRNAEFNGVKTKTEVRLGCLFEAVEAEEKFDVILFNAPYLPVERDEGVDWVEKAWAGGETGRAVIDKFIEQAFNHLAVGGCILLVQSSLSNVEETLRRLRQHALRAAVVDEEKLDFERIVLIKAKMEPHEPSKAF
jgi:release factor glutamine methyltransferase